jgi:hypothetical protein
MVKGATESQTITAWQKGQQIVKQDYSMAKGAQRVKQDYSMAKGPTDSNAGRQSCKQTVNKITA